jgi:hypothetical protein
MDTQKRFYLQTEFGSYYTPCEIVDKLPNGKYNVRYFDDVYGNMVVTEVRAEDLENARMFLND